MTLLSITFGFVVGLSLGLTGGGGTLFAVPLLVYGLDIPAREAVGISLAAVGTTSFVGFLHKWRLGDVEIRTGLIFAAAGMLGAPIGTVIAGWVSEFVLMLMFAGLMVLVAVRMWQQAGDANADCPTDSTISSAGHLVCDRDESGTLVLTSRCAVLLLSLGGLTGVLSGLFGVGGGFVIVPALVLFSRMAIHRAIGTSLIVVAMISASGVAAQLWSGQSISTMVTITFIVGGIAGMFSGQQFGRRLSGMALQRGFSVAILLVAVYLLVRNLNR